MQYELNLSEHLQGHQPRCKIRVVLFCTEVRQNSWTLSECWQLKYYLGCSNPAGTSATYIRFIPYIKKNYDYGVVIFLLTFNLITVSSYRVHSVLRIAQQRFYTIAIGCAICLFVTLFVFPNWSGEDLHNSTVSKLEGLAKSIEGMPYVHTHSLPFKQTCNILVLESPVPGKIASYKITQP